MDNRQSWMAREICATPGVLEQQKGGLTGPLQDLLVWLRRRPPDVVVTCARGSSAHAATFGKHLIERYVGLPVAAAAPNVASIYKLSPRLRDQLVLTISQSGRSDDLIAYALSAKEAGALTVAITNDGESPLAKICHVALPIGAGPEHSVAATKTFVATAATLLRLTAAWVGDSALLGAICRLPRRVELASALDWSAAVQVLSKVPHLTSIGRGPTLAIAREAALKLKEICALHTDTFSAAEFRHGPIALVAPGYPVLMLVPADAAADGMRQLARDLAMNQATLLIADVMAGSLPVLQPDQPETDALCIIQSFYAMMLALADRLDIDVDRPRNLQKITRTT